MTENSSQTIKESTIDSDNNNLKNQEHIENSSNPEEVSYEEKDIPSADSSSSRKNNDLENVGFTLDEFASLLGKYLSLIHI